MYSYLYCRPKSRTCQNPNQFLCFYKMFDNGYYRQQINEYTKPQSKERALYSKNLDYYSRQELLLEHKKNIINYQEYQDRKQRQSKAWIIASDAQGRKFKYNTLTKSSVWI